MIAHKTRRKRAGKTAEFFEEENPDRDYTLFLTLANLMIFAAAYRCYRERKNPVEMRKTELAMAGLAVHKMARLVSKDKVTRPLRAPFTTFEGSGGAGEVEEKPRGKGLRKTIGDLVSCPFCMSQWAANLMLLGYAYLPTLTRAYVWVLGMTNVSHFLNQAYAKAKELNEQE